MGFLDELKRLARPYEDEEEEEPEREEAKPRRRFGFWHKRNSDEADEEEEVQEDEEPEQEPDEAPAPARGAARLFHRQRPVQPPEEEASGTVELPALDAASHRSAPTVDRAPTRPMSQPATPARQQPVQVAASVVVRDHRQRRDAPQTIQRPDTPVIVLLLHGRHPIMHAPRHASLGA